MCACLLGAGDLAGLQAARADVGLTDMALGILDGDLLDIGTKDPVGHAMGVTDVAARRRVLSADFDMLLLLAANGLCRVSIRIWHIATRIQNYSTNGVM